MNPDEQQHQSLSSPLCQRCKSIDLQDFFSGASAGTDRIFHVFEPPHHLRPSECPLCCAIAFIRPDISENHVYHLVQAQTDMERAGNRLTVWQPGRSKAQIWTPHIGCRIRQGKAEPWTIEGNTPSFPGGLSLNSDLHPCENITLNLPGIIDFNVVKGWMNKCKKVHGQESKLESGASNIPNLRLIDCATRRIRLHQKGDIYVALSYCWGASQASQADGTETPFELPQHLPVTIEDAILATQKLGIKNIWIDRYCVPQGAEDPGRYEQISLMHKIYMGAEVTLIAAAGDCPTYGLPGVTKGRRKPPRVHFGSHTLVATLPDPRILIASSKWATRGWTYQEALLSRRRLVFTDQQVYFQCNKSISSINFGRYLYLGWSEAVSLSSLGIDSCNIPEDIDGFFEFELRDWQIWPRINEYTQRSLGRQEDIMNAMLGVLEKYVERKSTDFTFSHIFGIPIWRSTRWRLVWGMGYYQWYPSFLENLAWEHPTPSKRREGFPSWSWAGWEGTGFVADDCLWPVVNHIERQYAVVHAEQEDGMPAANMDLAIWKRNNPKSYWRIPHIIFECLSVPLHIKKVSSRPPPSSDQRIPQLENKPDLRLVMQSGEILHSYNFQLLPQDLVEDPGLEKGIPCVGLLLNPPKRPGVQLTIKFEGRVPYHVVVLLVMESHQRTGPGKTRKLYERIGKTAIPDKHLEGVPARKGYFTVG